MKLNHVGMTGKKHSAVTLEKFKLRKPPMKGRHHSIESRSKMSLAKKGFIPHNKGKYFGGLPRNLHDNIRELVKYYNWRNSIFVRDNFKCILCSKTGLLEAHHIVPMNIIIREYNVKNIFEADKCEKLWDINNGVSLCASCHKMTFKRELYFLNTFKNYIYGK